MTSAATDKSKRATNAVGVCIALICIGLLAYALVDCGPGETLRLVKTSGRKADAPYWDRQVTAVASNRFSMHPGSTGRNHKNKWAMLSDGGAHCSNESRAGRKTE